MARLPPDAHMGCVRLRVRDLRGAVDFYESVLGLRAFDSSDSGARLSPTGAAPALLELVADAHAPARPPGTSGLFHFALLVPTRRDLARTLLHIREARSPFQGFADHAVSESLYLADPEGNGIEIYADRPRSTWTREGGELRITTDPLDVAGLAAEADAREPWRGIAPGTVMGHVHLEVTDLDDGEAFYAGTVGFDVTARRYAGARFLSAGGYHHHLAINVWRGARRPPPAGALGLIDYEIAVPGRDGSRFTDPFGIGVVVAAS